MHDQLRVGMRLFILPPRNNFPLKEDAERVVLIAGGIGITPIYCMVKRMIELERPWELYYSCRSRMDTAFLDELTVHPQSHFHFDDEESGRFLQVAAIVEKLPKNAHAHETVDITLALVLNKTGRSGEAEPLLRETLAVTQQNSRRPLDVAQASGTLGECLAIQKRYAEAEPLLVQSYATLKSVQVPGSPAIKEARERLASLYAAWGKPSPIVN